MVEPADPPADPIVCITPGDVRGRRRGDVLHFAHVPYPAPPVGARRFAAPAPVPPWQGVRDGPSPGATAPQRLRAVPGLDIEPLVGDGWTAGDDYLTLDV